MNQTVKIAVVGTGANGASIGADMIEAGHDVTFIEQWPAHVEAMRENGLTVHLPDSSRTTNVRAYHICQVAELREKFDIVFISVKTYDSRWICELIKPVLHDKSLVVGLQNGMTIDDYAEILGPERTVGAVLGIAANMYDPGVVVRQIPPAGTWFTVGSYDGSNMEGIKRVAEVLKAAGTVEISQDIRSSKWMKLIANIPEMLPSALVGLPLMSAVKLEGMREIMDAAGREAYRLAEDLGITMLPIFGKTADQVPAGDQYAVDLLDAVLASYSLPDTKVAVLQDWEKGRRAEIDGFSGYIVDKRRELGGSAPVNEIILDVAERIERGELTPSPENVPLLVSAFAEISN